MARILDLTLFYWQHFNASQTRPEPKGQLYIFQHNDSDLYFKDVIWHVGNNDISGKVTMIKFLDV